MPFTPGWNMAAAVPDSAEATSSSHSDGAPAKKATASTPWVKIRTRSAPTIMARAPIRSAKTPPNRTNSTKGAVQTARTYPTPETP